MLHPSRRKFLQTAVTAAAAATTINGSLSSARADKAGTVFDVGSRRELFVDEALIESLSGSASQRLQHPTPRDVALLHDEPWEGTGSGYHSVFQDGDLYRMYYKAWHLDFSTGKLNNATHPLFCCYAESDDGISWRKPMLGLHDFRGSKQNNITMVTGPVGALNVDPGHPAVFKDENPNAAADAKYKAIFRSSNPNGLLPFKSPDGLNWSPMTEAPILRGLGAFDSQNLAFWDPNIGRYRAYWRIFTAGITSPKAGSIRAIRTSTSDDLVTWDPHTDLSYEDSPPEELYTNQIKPYHRAPHLLLGFPARYTDRGWSESMKALPAVEQRQMRSESSPRYGTAITDSLFMASRDGKLFKRWNEAFLRPGIERPEAWHYGHQYIGWHIVETRGDLPGAPNELSLYASESYWHGKGSAVRRYSLRLDGFVAVNGAAGPGGELLTRPLTFDGSALHLNFSTSAAGKVLVEVQHPDGSPVPGYAAADCHELFGDTTDRIVSWKNGTDVSSLAGQPIRLRFLLQDADLYAFQFTTTSTSNAAS